METIQQQKNLILQVIATGTMLLERFDYPVQVVKEDGFPVSSEIYIELEGSVPTTMAKSVGLATIEFASEFHRLEPDIVVLIGDRYEAFAAAIAAAYMNLCILHIQGGEVSGSIDESARHAITKLAHFHVPATRRAEQFLVRMGERPETILTVGCPSSDIARKAELKLSDDIVNRSGRGVEIDVSRSFLLTIYHPTTTEYSNERKQVEELLGALDEMRVQTLMLWPNIDAGSDHISKAIRIFRDRHNGKWFRNLINLSPENFIKVLANAACCVGNSSSFVRDASYFGTPVVLVGSRQDGREMDKNVITAPPLRKAIVAALKSQLAHGHYSASTLYGDGHVSHRIVEALASLKPYIQKRIHFVDEAN
jgi:UDP-hydrolysing UDP-N-acetyl-D-glucosamine 2-epimerase